MKALTLWQPWASLIVLGAKPFEFRRWRAPRSMVGQRIVIHASTRAIKPDEIADLRSRLQNPDEAWTTGLIVDRALEVLEQVDAMPLAAGIGSAILGEPVDGVEAAARVNAMLFNDSDRDEHANWAWPMTEIEAWPTPVAMRGAQGFWTWPDAEQFAASIGSEAAHA